MASRVLIAAAIAIILCSMSAAADPLFKADEAIPTDAIVLFDGKDLSPFVMCGSDKAATWKIENGYAAPQDGDICSKQKFKDCQLHVEFWVPLMADAQGEARGNSGVFFMGFTYEIQILDSYGRQQVGTGDCGAIYSVKPPMVNACRPPETWQSFDIVFRAPKFDEAGAKTASARVTVFQNGVLVQDNAEIPFPTPNHGGVDPKEPGPIELQWHGCPVRFGKVWARAL